MDYASFIFLFYIASFFRLLSHFVLLLMRPFFVLSLVCFSVAYWPKLLFIKAMKWQHPPSQKVVLPFYNNLSTPIYSLRCLLW